MPTTIEEVLVARLLLSARGLLLGTGLGLSVGAAPGQFAEPFPASGAVSAGAAVWDTVS